MRDMDKYCDGTDKSQTIYVFHTLLQPCNYSSITCACGRGELSSNERG